MVSNEFARFFNGSMQILNGQLAYINKALIASDGDHAQKFNNAIFTTS
jgi:hypothetical protein